MKTQQKSRSKTKQGKARDTNFIPPLPVLYVEVGPPSINDPVMRYGPFDSIPQAVRALRRHGYRVKGKDPLSWVSEKNPSFLGYAVIIKHELPPLLPPSQWE